MRSVVLAVGLVCSAAAAAAAQRYAAPLTDGIDVPGTSISGEFDARATVANPGGLPLLRGPELALALDEQNLDYATSGGPGFGAYFATANGAAPLPRLGMGMALEWLRPPRDQITPDPGEPFRFTLSTAVGLDSHFGVGFAWHHFHSDGSPLGGVNSFDLGLAMRLGAYVGVGATLKDLTTDSIGGVPVERRYALEVTGRPLATDRLELAVGGEVGESRGDTSGWLRAQVRVARGLWLMANFEDRSLHEIDTTPSGTVETDQREYRATVGFDLSLGNAGVAATATGVRGASGGNHALGGTTVVRLSAVGPPSVLPERDHYERVELSGDLGVRQLTQLIVQLRRVEHDDSVRGLLVVLDNTTAGWASLEEIRDELLAIRRAGKKVFAYFTWATGRDYYLASAADQIFVDPAGGLKLVGMAGQTLFFRGVLDQVGVFPQFEKIAEFKSAPEEFTERAPSPIAAQMHADLIDSIYDQWVAAIGDGRKLSPGEVKSLVEGGPYDAGELAHAGTGAAKLVDAVAPPEQVAALIAKASGDYPIAAEPTTRPDRWSRPKVAVIYVDGDITDGRSQSIPLLGDSLAGGETLVETIAAARNDSSIGAIILRIDSPGGSALASELIAREVFATRKVKPILCAMSNVAASGGYFVAAGCDAIYAEPMTITGSIGIFSGKLDVSGLAKKLGVDVDVYKHGVHADAESMFRPYTDEERGALMKQLRYMYGRFVGAVADGRGMTKDAVDAVGRGHVYTGAQAAPRKLVDKLGGIGAAIDEAKRRMGLGPDDRVDLVELPHRPKNLLGVVGFLIGLHAGDAPPSADVLAAFPGLKALLRDLPASMIVEPSAPQARLPYEIRFGD